MSWKRGQRGRRRTGWALLSRHSCAHTDVIAECLTVLHRVGMGLITYSERPQTWGKNIRSWRVVTHLPSTQIKLRQMTQAQFFSFLRADHRLFRSASGDICFPISKNKMQILFSFFSQANHPKVVPKSLSKFLDSQHFPKSPLAVESPGKTRKLQLMSLTQNYLGTLALSSL